MPTNKKDGECARREVSVERSKKRTMVMPRPRDPERQINQHLRTVHGARPLIIASPPGEEGAHKAAGASVGVRRGSTGLWVAFARRVWQTAMFVVPPSAALRCRVHERCNCSPPPGCFPLARRGRVQLCDNQQMLRSLPEKRSAAARDGLVPHVRRGQRWGLQSAEEPAAAADAAAASVLA
ncbi:unnamed protein product [Gadus morhua 'NCC']